MEFEEAAKRWMAAKIGGPKNWAEMGEVHFEQSINYDGCDTCGYGRGFYLEAYATFRKQRRTVRLENVEFSDLLKEIFELSSA